MDFFVSSIIQPHIDNTSYIESMNFRNVYNDTCSTGFGRAIATAREPVTCRHHDQLRKRSSSDRNEWCTALPLHTMLRRQAVHAPRPVLERCLALAVFRGAML